METHAPGQQPGLLSFHRLASPPDMLRPKIDFNKIDINTAAASLFANLDSGVFAPNAGFKFKNMQKGHPNRPHESLTMPNATRADHSDGDSGHGGSSPSTTDPDTHVSHRSKRRKRPLSKREPTREEYTDEEDFQSAWTKWRDIRDHNNKSVRLCRENAKIRRMQGEHTKHAGDSLQKNLARTQKELRLLVQMINRPDTLTDFDQAIAQRIIADNDHSADPTAQAQAQAQAQAATCAAPAMNKFLPFQEALAFARSLNLASTAEWKAWCKESLCPHNVPRRPDQAYSDGGWQGWGHWLGTFRSLNAHVPPPHVLVPI